MLYFSTRSLARNFANRTHRKVKDNGPEALKRWAVKVL